MMSAKAVWETLLHGALAIAIALMGAASLGGCEASALPPLVEIDDVSPRELEQGAEVMIRGAGFLPGERPRVVLSGTLYRAGRAPLEIAGAEAEGRVLDESTIALACDERLERAMTETPVGAVHSTFHGSVEVAFRAVAPGGPPLVARLPQVVLDFRPAPSLEVSAKSDRERRLRDFEAALGIQVAEAGSMGGVRIVSVSHEGLGRALGLEPNDWIDQVGGLRVMTGADLDPPLTGDDASLVLRRGREVVVTTMPTGARPDAPPVGWASLLVGLGVALAFGLGLALPWSVRHSASSACVRSPSRARRARRLSLWVRARGVELAVLGLGLLFCASLAVTPATWAWLDMPTVLAVALSIDLVAILVAGAPSLGLSVASSRAQVWKARAILWLMRALTLAAVFGVMLAAYGSVSLTEVGALASGRPWQWPLLARLDMAALGFVALAWRSPLGTRRGGHRSTRATLSTALDFGTLTLVAMAFAASIFGGIGAHLDVGALSLALSAALRVGVLVAMSVTMAPLALSAAGRRMLVSLLAAGGGVGLLALMAERWGVLALPERWPDGSLAAIVLALGAGALAKRLLSRRGGAEREAIGLDVLA